MRIEKGPWSHRCAGWESGRLTDPVAPGRHRANSSRPGLRIAPESAAATHESDVTPAENGRATLRHPRALMDPMIFETRCAGCDKPGTAICTTCRFALLGPPPRSASHGVIAAVPFTGRARNIVLGWKYRNRRAVSRHMAGLIVNRLIAERAHHDIDLVTWAPTSAKRRRERGFDQGELLARSVARQLRVPCRRLLDRKDSSAQTGRTRAERLHGPTFAARPGLEGARVLVVDDVVTTGSTLGAAAAALNDRGAVARLAAIASTPDRRRAKVVPLHHHITSSAA